MTQRRRLARLQRCIQASMESVPPNLAEAYGKFKAEVERTEKGEHAILGTLSFFEILEFQRMRLRFIEDGVEKHLYRPAVARQVLLFLDSMGFDRTDTAELMLDIAEHISNMEALR